MEGGEGSSAQSYYTDLGVNPGSSMETIKRAYRKLAMQWHPDRFVARTPSLLGHAKRKFQQIQEAYSVLSDDRKRVLYDAGFYDPNEEEDEGFNDFMHELISLMGQNKRENKYYSLEELQSMLVEMAQGLEIPSGEWEPSSCRSKRLRYDFNQNVGGGSNGRSGSCVPVWGDFGATSYCS